MYEINVPTLKKNSGQRIFLVNSLQIIKASHPPLNAHFNQKTLKKKNLYSQS